MTRLMLCINKKEREIKLKLHLTLNTNPNSQFGVTDSNDNVLKEGEINWQAYRIGNGNEAHRRINERRTKSVNISPSSTGRAAVTYFKWQKKFEIPYKLSCTKPLLFKKHKITNYLYKITNLRTEMYFSADFSKEWWHHMKNIELLCCQNKSLIEFYTCMR